MKKHYSAGSSIIAVRTVIDGTQDTLNWLVGDHLGSTSLVTDSSGVVVSEVRYSAFGEMSYLNGETVTDLLYTGQKLEEELGLYYYVARWYPRWDGLSRRIRLCRMRGVRLRMTDMRM